MFHHQSLYGPDDFTPIASEVEWLSTPCATVQRGPSIMADASDTKSTAIEHDKRCCAESFAARNFKEGPASTKINLDATIVPPLLGPWTCAPFKRGSEDKHRAPWNVKDPITEASSRV